MIVGIGVDVCDIGRMARELSREDHGFRDQVFTPREVRECSHRRSADHFAERFAAKEATLKALGTGLIDAGVLREIEVHSTGDRFTIRFHHRIARIARARGIARARAAVVHVPGCALAGVVLESGEEESA